MSRPIHFEIHADDFDRAQAFYEGLFGWSFAPFGPDYRLITTGPDAAPGINGGLFRRMAGQDPAKAEAVIAWVCTVDVEDIDRSLARCAELGGRQVVDKQTIPGVGTFAYAKDTEGNIFGMMQGEAGT